MYVQKVADAMTSAVRISQSCLPQLKASHDVKIGTCSRKKTLKNDAPIFFSHTQTFDVKPNWPNSAG